jgi:hypothetical protein
LGGLFVALFAFDDVSHVEAAFAAFSLSSEAIFMEGVSTHEIN